MKAVSPQEISSTAAECHADKICGIPITLFFCVELFSSLRALNLRKSFGVDFQKISYSKAPIIVVDLSPRKHQDLVMQWIRNPLCCYVHMGIRVGTSSRAREIRMSAKPHGPKPLRSYVVP